MLARDTIIRASYGNMKHTSSWGVYRMALIRAGGIDLALAASIALETSGIFAFNYARLERIDGKKSRKID